MKTQITRTCIGLFAIVVVTVGMIVSATAQSVMIVDRGLPTANLNGPSYETRSNIALGTPVKYGFFGDDFTVPQPTASGTWRIDTIRLWFVGGPATNDTDLANDSYLGDQSLGNLSLWVGTNGSRISKALEANFRPGSNATNNSRVVATRVQYSENFYGAFDYENPTTRCTDNGCYTPPAGFSTIYQIDFKGLNLSYPAGARVWFGMFTDGAGGLTTTHASNAELSAARQDQSDGYWILSSCSRATKRILILRGEIQVPFSSINRWTSMSRSLQRS